MTRNRSWTFSAKNVLLFLIPLCVSLYCLSLLTSYSGMEVFGWVTVGLGAIYALIDRLSEPRELEWFGLAVDIPLIGLAVVVIAGLLMNDSPPTSNFFDELGWMRWIPLLYLFAFTFHILPLWNRVYQMLLFAAVLLSLYAIIQHFTGLDVLAIAGLSTESSVHPASNPAEGFISTGLFDSPMAFGFCLSQLIGFPFAAFLLGQRRSRVFRWMMFLSTLIIALGCAWTYGHGVWIAALAALITVTGFVGRRYMITLGVIVALGAGAAFQMSPGFHDHVVSLFSDTDLNSADRRDLWHANLKMFEEHPWIGVGLRRNESRLPEYYQKLNVTHSSMGEPILANAHNTYFEWLATTGLFGFICLMSFVLLTLLATLRLWNEIPQTHFWHRVFVLGSLGAQLAICTGGLTQWNLGYPEVNHLYCFLMAWTLYFAYRYGKDIIPDDYAL